MLVVMNGDFDYTQSPYDLSLFSMIPICLCGLKNKKATCKCR
jgi:hypothetical protein